MYKFVIPDIKRKKNNFFWIFLKYWSSSRDFNTLVIKAKMHAKTYIYFLKFSLLYENTLWFFIYSFILFTFYRLGRMHENEDMFFFMFWRKPGILIPDLYFYCIKLQTDISQNSVKKIRGEITNFPKYFLDWKSGLVNSRALSTVHMLREQWRWCWRRRSRRR
jgi:hypothetical protein